EILRVREMEEAQRYFFSAASHELKTPIAATSILLEGMLENVGDYKDHPKYLRECMKMMDAQDNVISEILEIVNLSDGKISQDSEKL
ncbi:vancomycin resistance histidine kinase VanS, partial [Bacillus thuringiensis]|nr:vancomycin resistance histidine kinase VanS [Bacillus thuringiensis]